LTGSILNIKVGSNIGDPETWIPTNKYVTMKGKKVLIYILNDIIRMDVTLLGDKPETIKLSKT